MIEASRSIVVLVDPEKPRNIGFCARAMKCNGLEELRIVSTRFPKMHSAAYITGTSGKDVLDNAKFYNTIHEALADIQLAVAFSRRMFARPEIQLDLPEVHEHFPEEGKVAFVYGRESQGLNKEEMYACHMSVAIPTAGTLSYNLGQAVSISLYEMIQKGSQVRGQSKFGQAAPIGEHKAFVDYLHQILPEGFLEKGNKEFFLDALLKRMAPNEKELKSLFGIIKKIADHTPEQSPNQTTEILEEN